VCCSVLQCVAVCCSVLQCVAVCCSVLQCVGVCCSAWECVAVCWSLWQCVSVFFSVLQRVAASCSVLQRLEGYYSAIGNPIMQFCSVLQCVAVCCSVLLCVAVCGSKCKSISMSHTTREWQHTGFLPQRKNSKRQQALSSANCFITDDQTVSSEREYSTVSFESVIWSAYTTHKNVIWHTSHVPQTFCCSKKKSHSFIWECDLIYDPRMRYGMATISRLLKIVGLFYKSPVKETTFCKRDL